MQLADVVSTTDFNLTTASSVDDEVRGHSLLEICGSFYLTLLDTLVFAGNGGMIFLVCKTRKYHTVSGIFLLNLAAADITVGVATVPLTHAVTSLSWIPGSYACRAMGVLLVSSCSSSSWSLCLVSVERYVSVFYPFRRGRACARTAVFAPLAMWTYSAAHAALMLAYRDGYVWASAPLRACGPNAQQYPAFVAALAILDLLLPSAITAFSYGSIYREAKRHSVVIRSLNVPEKPNDLISAGTTRTTAATATLVADEGTARKAACVIVIITGAFNVCWLPFGGAALGFALGGQVPPQLMTLLLWIALTNSAINPLMYAVLNRQYREEARHLLGCSRAGSSPLKSVPENNINV